MHTIRSLRAQTRSTHAQARAQTQTNAIISPTYPDVFASSDPILCPHHQHVAEFVHRYGRMYTSPPGLTQYAP